MGLLFECLLSLSEVKMTSSSRHPIYILKVFKLGFHAVVYYGYLFHPISYVFLVSDLVFYNVQYGESNKVS